MSTAFEPPVPFDAGADVGVDAGAKDTQGAEVGPLNIMLVDDCVLDTYLHRRALERSTRGRVAACFDDPLSAIDWLRSGEREIDLLLLDVNMPLMTGFEFLELVRSDPRVSAANRSVRVVLLTSSMAPADEQMASELGVPLRNKPIDVAQVDFWLASIAEAD
ncbi:MAG: response regulator [Pseudomonadota bacterium]